MKTSFFMFFLIVLGIYTVGNVYLYIRGWQALEILGKQRVWFTVLFWVAASSFVATQVLRINGVSGWLFDFFFTLGSFWIAVMLYGFISLLIIDIARIIGWTGNIKPGFIYQNYIVSKAALLGTVCLVLAVILAIGYRNATRPEIIRLEIPVNKQARHLKNLRVAMISDVHLGHTTGRRFLGHVVDRINGQQPDIVLLAGDVFDGSPEPVIKKNMCAEFGRLKSKYGAYAVSGNHEYIGERETPDAVRIAFDYLASCGVKPLQDTVVLIDESFYVAGRNDRSDTRRKTVSGLLAGIDHQRPVILLDHQPYHLEETEQAGVDLQLSGHTHHGQMWPMNHITGRIYEQDWGYLQKGKSNFYVSCGVSTWGPPVRLASRSEIVVIDLKFDNNTPAETNCR